MSLLSKSDYMLFLKHPAWLWLKKHDKSKLPELDDNTQAVFDAGHAFEAYAEQLFPEGLRLGFADYDEYLTLPVATQKAIDDGAKTVFQGRFESGDITCICDVVDVVGGNTVDLYEIKSSTKAKPEHEFDLAFQMVVLEKAGYAVRNIAVVHVNNAYVRNGDIAPKELTSITDVTEAVKSKREQTTRQIELALSVASSTTMPDPSPAHAKLGSLSEWLTIYRGLVDIETDSIYDLGSPGAQRLGKLEELGIKRLVDIPDDFDLTDKQRLQVKAAQQGCALVDPAPIKTFLDSLEYPLYFLDYETMTSIVPYFDGLKPYQQVPFQYSLHILDALGAELRQVEYLHRDNSNPAEHLSMALQSHIGRSGTVITWNMVFEKSCNTLLGSLLSEYAEFYEQLNERTVDLMLPFASGWYVDKGFRGSASIKNVLPVLVPELSYKTLEIQEGQAAQRLWMEAVLDGKRDDEKEAILANLVEYCGQDTLAMVKIYEVLEAL